MAWLTARVNRRVSRRELDTTAPQLSHYCTDSRWRHQREMAILYLGYSGLIYVQWEEAVTHRPSLFCFNPFRHGWTTHNWQEENIHCGFFSLIEPQSNLKDDLTNSKWQILKWRFNSNKIINLLQAQVFRASNIAALHVYISGWGRGGRQCWNLRSHSVSLTAEWEFIFPKRFH